MTLRPFLAALAACLLTGASELPKLGGKIPTVLQGRWTVVSVEGADPALLEVSKASDLVGRTITITPEHVVLWSVFDGVPHSYGVVQGTLGTVLAVPPAVSQANAFPDDGKPMEFLELSFESCMSEGKALPGCPTLVFAQDPQSGTTSLVTTPWGLAQLKPAAP